MKYSGFPWLGDIPSNWEVRKVKDLYSLQTGFTPDTKHDEYYDKNGHAWVTISDLSGKYAPTHTNKGISDIYLHKFPQPVTPSGSLLYSFKLSVGQVAKALTDIYTNEAIASFLPQHGVNLDFLFYSSCLIENNANDNIYGAKILNQELIRNAYIVNPPLDEQAKIAEFLDKKCTEIDTVISDSKKSIEEYKKAKVACISDAATRGIDSNRKMKPSRIGWIKNIPFEWKEEKCKHLFTETNERSTTGEEELLTVSHITGVTPRSEKNVTMFMSESLVDYKICHIGDIAANTMWMWQGAIGVSKYEGVISPSYNTYRQTLDIFNPEYLDYLLRIPALVEMYKRYSTGITLSRLRLYPNEFFLIWLPIPPQKEQESIVKFLNVKCKEYDSLIANKQRFINDLENYKKSLIYEYVTGKKEIE